MSNLTYKICVIGGEKSGKTSLIHRIAIKSFTDDDIKPAFLMTKKLEVNDKQINIELHEYQKMNQIKMKKFYENMQALIICANIQDICSLCVIGDLIEEMQRYTQFPKRCFFIGTFNDGVRETDETEMVRMAQNLEATYISSSSKSGEGFEQLMFDLKQSIVSDLHLAETETKIKDTPTKNRIHRSRSSKEKMLEMIVRE